MKDLCNLFLSLSIWGYPYIMRISSSVELLIKKYSSFLKFSQLFGEDLLSQ